MQQLLRIRLKIGEHGHIPIILILPVIDAFFRNRNVHFIFSVAKFAGMTIFITTKESFKLVVRISIDTIEQRLRRWG
jgi:hypothetical protein